MGIREPYRSHFIALLEKGAASQDIFDESSKLQETDDVEASPEFIRRELDRVAMHSRGFVALLAAHGVACRRVLDVGCSTGGSTAAIALSAALHPSEVFGVDPNRLSIEAAKIRALALGIQDSTRFEAIVAGRPLPFADGQFDLVVAVSVLEFIPSVPDRRRFLVELERVATTGGFIYIATPSILWLRELHSRRWLGNVRRTQTEPWASSGSFIRRALTGCTRVHIRSTQARLLMDRARMRKIQRLMVPVLAPALAFAPWQKLLFRKL